MQSSWLRAVSFWPCSLPYPHLLLLPSLNPYPRTAGPYVLLSRCILSLDMLYKVVMFAQFLNVYFSYNAPFYVAFLLLSTEVLSPTLLSFPLHTLCLIWLFNTIPYPYTHSSKD